MEEHGLSEYLDQLDFLGDSEDQVQLDQEEHFLLQQDPLPSNLQDQDQPQLHPYPFDFEKEEQPTYERTYETDVSSQPEPDVIDFDLIKVVEYRNTFQGTKDDTVELNINFKTLLVGYFRQLIYLKQLTEQEVKKVEQFSSRMPSFQSLRQFYQQKQENKGIRSRCLSFLESGDCIRRIMRGRCRMKTKLMMIKFIQKMRVNLSSQKTVKWKDNIRWKQKTVSH